MLDSVIDEIYAQYAIVSESNAHGEHWKARSPKHGEIEGYQLDAMEYIKCDDSSVIVRDRGVTVDVFQAGEIADFIFKNAIEDYRN